MTLEEVSAILGLNPNTIKYHFNRTKESLARRGITLRKEGRGESADYSFTWEKPGIDSNDILE